MSDHILYLVSPESPVMTAIAACHARHKEFHEATVTFRDKYKAKNVMTRSPADRSGRG